jgi:hypothetical protein
MGEDKQPQLESVLVQAIQGGGAGEPVTFNV